MKTFKKQLIIEVEFDGDTITSEEADQVLNGAAFHLADNGLLGGDRGEVVSYDSHVEDVPSPLVVPPSKQS